MRTLRRLSLFILVILMLLPGIDVYAQQKAAGEESATGPLSKVPHTHHADVIYGHKHGMALTMDVYEPKENANGAGIIAVVSGGWVSDHPFVVDSIKTHFLAEPVKRGYTVFAVSHGSQPTFTIPEIVNDLHRAVRYIRHHASDYHIDGNRLGITGGSAGGHLSLMQGTAGNGGNPQSADPVERESSRVQAVACLFPPTDFLNYGGTDKYAFAADGVLAAFQTAIDVRQMNNTTMRLERLDDAQQKEIARQVSPIFHVSADDPPTLVIHGDADVLVPIQQAEAIVAKLKEVGVRAELITRPGRGHDFNGVEKDIDDMTNWFDEHLKK